MDNKAEHEADRKAWYALHVRTGCEEDVALDVYGLGDTATLLPIEHFMIRTASGLRERKKVLMPGYVFVECVMTPHVWQGLRHTKNVLRILGDPYEEIPDDQMTNLIALYWHCINGTKAVRVGGVPQVIEGPLLEVTHEITCADEREGTLTVLLDLPGGKREVTVHAEFIKQG